MVLTAVRGRVGWSFKDGANQNVSGNLQEYGLICWQVVTWYNIPKGSRPNGREESWILL